MEDVCSKLSSQSICDTGFPEANAPDGKHCIVLLYDSAASAVHIHDVIDVVGVLDHAQHSDDTCSENVLVDDFNVIMDAENGVCNENEGATLAQHNVRFSPIVHWWHKQLWSP